jgi:homoserine dehydrogenase
MSVIEVLKFGSSVLRSAKDLPVAVDEIYRHWRAGCRVLAVVSAFEGETDRLIGDAVALLGADSAEGLAAYVATGEQRTAALLTGSLQRSGLPARLVDPREIALRCEGTCLESAPVGVDAAALERLWQAQPILVLPGFYGIDAAGRIALFGRGGSDLSALFIAAEVGARCRLLKDVRGVFDADPAVNPAARRFAAVSWESAVAVAGPLIQGKALRYARARALPFEVGRPNGEAATAVGEPEDRWADPAQAPAALRVALLGCGSVGRGVHETLLHYPDRFELTHVLVRNPAKYPGLRVSADPAVAGDPSIDVLIECIGGTDAAYSFISAALRAGKFVVTANKAVVSAHWESFARHARGPDQRLFYSAAVGGALPVLETLALLTEPVREIRGILNGTCGAVLESLAAGRSFEEAVTLAQAAGFAEANPQRDLSGRDAADKLSLLIESAFGVRVSPESIPTEGLDARIEAPAERKLIARARRAATAVADAIEAEVRLESPPHGSFLAQARGAENRVEIELAGGRVVQLRGQGAGRWPTAVSVLGDLHEIARRRRALARSVSSR